jgi:glutathione S-transferase
MQAAGKCRLCVCLMLATAGIILTPGADAKPESLIADHPRVRLQHRPSGGKGSAIDGAELHYFFLRGLGEIPRLMLELTETPYDSVMYFSRETKEYKEYAPFGQMPVYTDKELGRWIAQQGSIIRHIARRTGLGGKNAQDEAVVDMIFEGAKDIWGKKDLVHEGAASESADAKKLQMYLTAAARMLGDKMYFVYDTPTYADVAMFHVLLTLEEIVAPASSYLSDVKHPNLVAFVQRFKELPSIKIYLASDRRVPITAKEMGKGSSDYNYMAPLSDAVLAHIDSVKTEL